MSLTQSKTAFFRKLSIVTLIAIYLLILVGGIVRSTGSGMGCPDWPKCFGSWVPPTQADQLSSDYKEIYAQKRIKKNERLASYLEAIGFSHLAYEIMHDPEIAHEGDFNAAKTWTEYINRLIGVVIGLLIIATAIVSLIYWKQDKVIVYIAWMAVVAIGFQGWIGSVVVSTNLLPWLITVHMLIALLIVCMLTYIVARSAADENRFGTTNAGSVTVNRTVIVLLIVTLVQIILGTQVRESVNEVAAANQFQNRQLWIGQLDWIFYVHRSFSLVVLAAHIFLAYKLFKIKEDYRNLYVWGVVLLAIIVLEIVSGVVMAYFDIPRFAQPIHLLLASVAFGIQFLLILNLNRRRLFPAEMHRTSPDHYVSY